MGAARAGHERSVAVDVDPNVQKKLIFFKNFREIPRVLPARENRISTQGSVQAQLRSINSPYEVIFVCLWELPGLSQFKSRGTSPQPKLPVECLRALP